jgi:hypothetical protein
MVGTSFLPQRGKMLGFLAKLTAERDFPGFLTSRELTTRFALPRNCIAVHSPPPAL